MFNIIEIDKLIISLRSLMFIFLLSGPINITFLLFNEVSIKDNNLLY